MRHALLRVVLALAFAGIMRSSAHAEFCPIRGYGRALGDRVDQAMPMLFVGPHRAVGTGSCQDEECRAAWEVFCTAVAMSNIGWPNTMGYLTPEGAMQALREGERYISTFPYAHPRRIPLYCTYLTRLAALTPDEPKRDGDNSVRYTVELALRIWPLDRSCLGRVRAAFPDTPAIRGILELEQECLNRPAWCLPRLLPRVHLARHRNRRQ